MLKKFKRQINKNNFYLTKEDLEKYNSRILELKELSQKAIKDKNFDKVTEYVKELTKITKILKLAEKNAKKIEKKRCKDNGVNKKE